MTPVTWCHHSWEGLQPYPSGSQVIPGNPSFWQKTTYRWQMPCDVRRQDLVQCRTYILHTESSRFILWYLLFKGTQEISVREDLCLHEILENHYQCWACCTGVWFLQKTNAYTCIWQYYIGYGKVCVCVRMTTLYSKFPWLQLNVNDVTLYRHEILWYHYIVSSCIWAYCAR